MSLHLNIVCLTHLSAQFCATHHYGTQNVLKELLVIGQDPKYLRHCATGICGSCECAGSDHAEVRWVVLVELAGCK